MTPNDSARAAATEVERVINAFGTQAAARDGLIQLAVLAVAFGIAWLVARALRSRVSTGPVRWKFGEGGFHRVAFPAVALVLVVGARAALNTHMHTPFLRIATTLLIAYAAIRLCVYILRFLLPEGSLLRASERTIAWLMWIGVALHVTGLLPEVRDMLSSVSIPVGQQRLSLLMVFDGAIAVAITLAITMWLARIVEGRVMGNADVEMSTRVVVSKLVNAIAFFIAVVIALPLAGLDLTALTVFGGALGVGLGFGLQKIASNYVSGYIILLDRSVRIGDLVTIDNRYGTVREISSRCTIVKSGDGTESLIPNELLITQSVTNHSYSDRKAALKVPMVLPHDADVDAAIASLLAAAKGHPQVVSDPAPVVLATRILDTGIEIELTCWIPDIATGVGQLRSDLLRATVKDFAARGIPVRPAPREVLLATGETGIPTNKSAT